MRSAISSWMRRGRHDTRAKLDRVTVANDFAHPSSPNSPMKTLLLSIVLAAVSAVQAATITFTGVVDQSSQFSVGDVFTATFQFDPHKGRVSRYVITVGNEFTLNGTKGGGMIALDNNPAHGSVYYQVINSDFTEITLQGATPNGVIPPIDQFNLNDFSLSPAPSGISPARQLSRG